MKILHLMGRKSFVFILCEIRKPVKANRIYIYFKTTNINFKLFLVNKVVTYLF